MRSASRWSRVVAGAIALAVASAARAQDASAPVRAPEGSPIINLPSAEVAGPATLQVLFTHRFSQPVQDSDIHSLFSFDSGADIGLGLAYTPLTNLEVALLRNKSLEDYELSVKYRFLSTAQGPVALSLRVGGDARTASRLTDRASFFAQAIAAVSLFSRVRITAVPTYSSRAAGQIVGVLTPLARDVFNVPVAISVAMTSSINVQGEYVPRHDSPGAAWIVAVEKTVLRHRFAFTAGNLRPTTVDQYVTYDFAGLPTRNIYLGFNLTRQWKLK